MNFKGNYGDDVAACVTKVEQLGGQIVIPPQVLPGGDEMAWCWTRRGYR
jgi:predicted enzyme related to lactoylglutathione lyase